MGQYTIARMKIIYLFLSEENRMTNEQTHIFDKVGSLYEGFAEERGRIIEACSPVLAAAEKYSDKQYRFDIIKEEISQIAESPECRYKNIQKTILWQLVDIVYRRGEFSDNRQEIIDSLVSRWKIDPSTFDEMKDISRTLIALREHKKWISALTTQENNWFSMQTQNQEKQLLLAEVDKNWADMSVNIDALINFG